MYGVKYDRNMKNMKLILILLAIGFSIALQAQVTDSLALHTFEGKTFKTNQVIGLKDFEYDSLVSTIELAESTKQFSPGNITTFNDGVFSSGNFGPCGNECRVTVSGKYFFKEDKIHLFLETISFWKDCSDLPKRTINKEIGAFAWYKGENGTIILTAEEDDKE